MKRLITSLILFAAPALVAADKPIDYQTLDLTLTLSALRSGNHDSSGTNNYYFQTKIYGVAVIKEDIKKPFADRKKSEADLGKFAEIKIDSLKYWTADKKPVGTQMTITGDRIRALVAETMNAQSVPEDQTAVVAVVTMYEMNKKFGWLGDDLTIGEASFDIIPESLPHGAKIENKTLNITDKQGTFVEIKLEYKSLIPKTPKP
ncbi:MAG: hypothetical protein EOP04_15525 [Proteobacteria bacterium]|nr:MAG: hypothetical protein EOP04_15525 [Pseudomonadota bacterium]